MAEPHNENADAQADPLANAFSKKWEKLYAMLALYFAWYNFWRVHQTLRVTPAMEAGITDHIWMIQELLGA